MVSQAGLGPTRLKACGDPVFEDAAMRRLMRSQVRSTVWKKWNLIWSGRPGRSRTCDTRIKSPVLYQLSYWPTNYFILFYFCRSASTIVTRCPR